MGVGIASVRRDAHTLLHEERLDHLRKRRRLMVVWRGVGLFRIRVRRARIDENEVGGYWDVVSAPDGLEIERLGILAIRLVRYPGLGLSSDLLSKRSTLYAARRP